MTNVGFGASNFNSYTTDASTTLIATNVSVPSRRTAYNGKGPQLITDVAMYAAGYSGTITFKLYADGKKTGSISRSADSTPGSTGYLALTSDLFIADGTTVTFGVSGPSGGVYFARASSGTTTGTGANTYTWAGTMRGAYTYVECPTAPQNLTATPSKTTSGVVSLAWSTPSDSGGASVNGYEVYASTGGTYSYIGFTSGTSYTASGLTAGASYSFQVRACNAVTDAAGTTSVSSNTATVISPSIIISTSAPSAPTSLTATTSTTTLGAVNLSWVAPTSDGGSSVTDYRIYVDGVYFGALGSATLTSTPDYVVTGLSELSTHSFTVTAVNANGEGPQAASVSQSASGVPTKPLNLFATADNLVSNKINLVWDAPSQTGGGVTGYLIYKSSDNYATPVDQAGTTRTYSETGLMTGTEYSYYVKAYNAIGIAQAPDVYSPASDSASATAITVTGAPSVTSSATIPTRLTLNWTATAGASSYLLTNVTTSETKTVSANIISYVWDGLTTNTQYGFTKKPDNGATSEIGYGTTGQISTQTVSGTKTVTDTTNASLSSSSVVVTSASPTTFTYSKTVANVAETQILSLGASTATNTLNKLLTDADGTVTKSISAVTDNTFSYVNTGAPDLASTNVSGGTTILNKTNQQLNSDSAIISSVNAGAKTFTYSKSTDGSVITGNIANTSSGGTATNLSQTSFNVTSEPITATTEYTVSYAKTASDQATSAATGTVVNETNKTIFNATVGSAVVATAPDYKTITYSVDGSTNVAESTVEFPVDSATRTASNEDTKLDIVYRSGWIG
jgi:hypothetical protein